MRKVVSGFGKKGCVSTDLRKPENTCVTDRRDMTLAVKVALNPNTTDQPTFSHGVFKKNPCRHVKSRACLGKD